jgi:hypothetical protein
MLVKLDKVKCFTVVLFISDIMESKPIIIELGRQRGNTIPGEEKPNDNSFPHYFLFFDDARRIPYRNNNIVVVREVRETGNNSQSTLKVLGIYRPKDFKITEEKVSVPISKDSVVRGFDLQEDVRRKVLQEYRTEEKVDFSL